MLNLKLYGATVRVVGFANKLSYPYHRLINDTHTVSFPQFRVNTDIVYQQ